ncbi:MAG: hypothetical protein ACOX6I_07865 [Syntrophomonadaceae bacterium]|jgi:hypothetical protein
MPDKQKVKKRGIPVEKKPLDNECPQKEGDNCLVPGGFNDSEPIGGG